MKKIELFIDKHYPRILIVFAILIFVNTCGNPNKQLTRKVESLSEKIDSLQSTIVTREDLKIEGLKAEKRMIQSTDRKMFDVNRQSEIDKEISLLEK